MFNSLDKTISGAIKNVKEIKERVDIVDVIGKEIYLKRTSREWKGCCPFHEDKSPSFFVYPQNEDGGRYYCFGCKASGDVIDFLREYKQLSFVDAVTELASIGNIPVELTASIMSAEQRQKLDKEIELKSQLREVLALTSALYEHQLHKNADVLRYLESERRLTTETIQSFGLGYAPGGDFVYKHLARDRRYSFDVLYRAGLVNKNSEDFFVDRLIIPIRDGLGHVVALGARSLNSAVKPKYKNSPDSILFKKSNCLFGIDKASDAIKSQDQVIVVEGYFDVMALHQAGVAHVVACMGTSLTVNQVLLASKLTSNIVLNIDSDSAGEAATERLSETDILDFSSMSQANITVCEFPHPLKDADEFLLYHSADIYLQLVKDSSTFFKWLLDRKLDRWSLDSVDPSDKALFRSKVEIVAKLLEPLTDSALKSYYLNYASQILARGNTNLGGIYAQAIVDKIAEQKKRPSKPRNRGGVMYQIAAKKIYTPSQLELTEEKLIQAWLHYPCHRGLIIEQLEDRSLNIGATPCHKEIWKEIVNSYFGDNDPSEPDVLDKVLYLDYTSQAQTELEGAKLKRLLTNNGEMQSRAAVISVLANLEYQHLERYWRKCQERSSDPYYWNQLKILSARKDQIKREIFGASF